jgi:catechol 2,3-dioxygenase-like lactoylglutathione lyase family enzyme
MLAAWSEQACAIDAPRKRDQDALDACLCLLVALHLARGRECLWVGDIVSGYILVPHGGALHAELEARCGRTGREPAQWLRRIGTRIVPPGCAPFEHACNVNPSGTERQSPSPDHAMTFEAPIPLLRIFDEAKAREFYVDFLGFAVDWEHRFDASLPLYMQVSRDRCVLHLSAHHGDASPGAALRVRTDALDALHAALTAKQYRYARPGIVEQPWGRDMTVTDPFGNRLTFCDAGDT